PTLFPYTTLFRSLQHPLQVIEREHPRSKSINQFGEKRNESLPPAPLLLQPFPFFIGGESFPPPTCYSEEAIASTGRMAEGEISIIPIIRRLIEILDPRDER